MASVSCTPPTPVTVFLHLRNAALRGETANTGWAEWSVERQTDPRDVDAWYETNPSPGSIRTERRIADEIGSDAVDFNIQRLGMWLQYDLRSAISAPEWEALCLPTAAAPELAGRLYAGVKFGRGEYASLSIAARTAGGKIFVEAIDIRPMRAGVGWLLVFLRQADLAAVVVDGANGQRPLADIQKDAFLR